MLDARKLSTFPVFQKLQRAGEVPKDVFKQKFYHLVTKQPFLKPLASGLLSNPIFFFFKAVLLFLAGFKWSHLPYYHLF